MIHHLDEAYRIDAPEEILSPQTVVFRPLVIRNIETMIRMAGAVDRLRPHCKTHKMPAVVRLQLERGITKQKAATFAEAEMLADAGVEDIFLAYNLVGPNIGRAVRFRQRFPQVKFAVTADDPYAIGQLGKALADAGETIHVLLDVNPGRDRTGVLPGDAGAEIYRLINDTPGLVADGFHLYDGHQHQHALEERIEAVQAAWEPVAAFRDRLIGEGLDVPRIVCGGTPTFPVYARMEDPCIELSPGTCIFHDASYGESFPDLEAFKPAQLVFTRVISRPTPNRVTFDVGTKAVAADPPMGKRVVLPALPDAVQVLQNEEHLVVESEQAGTFQVGDWTLAIPRHVCPTTALHREAVVIENGVIVDTWEVIARDRRLTI